MDPKLSRHHLDVHLNNQWDDSAKKQWFFGVVIPRALFYPAMEVVYHDCWSIALYCPKNVKQYQCNG